MIFNEWRKTEKVVLTQNSEQVQDHAKVQDLKKKSFDKISEPIQRRAEKFTGVSLKWL